MIFCLRACRRQEGATIRNAMVVLDGMSSEVLFSRNATRTGAHSSILSKIGRLLFERLLASNHSRITTYFSVRRPSNTLKSAMLCRRCLLGLYSGRAAVEKARSEGGAVAVFGHRWGGELRLPKRNGAGNYFADWVLARLDSRGELVEFTSIEVQTIDTTGNYRDSRAGLIDGRREVKSTVGLNWENVSKRIIPQLVYKGQVLQREPLCRSGLWFVTPESVYSRILERLGGADNMAFGYAPQPGALHFLRYDYDADCQLVKGAPTRLKVIGDECTTVEQVQAAFNRVRLPEPGVYGKALREALYG